MTTDHTKVRRVSAIQEELVIIKEIAKFNFRQWQSCLIAFMEKQQVTREDLAYRTGWDVRTINNLLDKDGLPNILSLMIIAYYAGCNLQYDYIILHNRVTLFEETIGTKSEDESND